MLQDLKWGFGGGFAMTLVACLAAASGLISSLRAMPLIAGGALLILITLIVILSRNGKDIPIAVECISEGAQAATAGPNGQSSVLALQQLPQEPEGGREAASDWSSSAPTDLFRALPPTWDEAATGASMNVRQAQFRFSVGDTFAEFLLRIPPNASSSEIAQKAVEVAEAMMGQQGVSKDERGGLEVVGGRWVPLNS
jgi:hypothetical protein